MTSAGEQPDQHDTRDDPADRGTQAHVDGQAWCSVALEAGPVPVIVVRDRVRLYDTDSSGLIYYGAVTAWLTRTQSELWLALGFRQESTLPSPMMPVVNANVSYHAALALGDSYEVRAHIAEAGRTSLTLAFDITRTGTRCVSATMTHVHLDAATGRPAPLPAAMRAAAGTVREP